MEAYHKELDKLERLGGLTTVRRKPHMECIPFIEVLTEKIDNVTGERVKKVRLAARGDLEVNGPTNVYSPASGAPDLRCFIIAMRAINAFVMQGDCPSAYLNGRLKNKVYLYLPDGHPKKTDSNDYVYECGASLYGLAVAGRVWYNHFVQIVQQFGLYPNQRSPCLFVKADGPSRLYLQLYVDDFLMGSSDQQLLRRCAKFL